MRTIPIHDMRLLAESGELEGNASPIRLNGEWWWRAMTKRGETIEARADYCAPCDAPVADDWHDAITESGGLAAGRRG